jgi:hypothetical protein
MALHRTKTTQQRQFDPGGPVRVFVDGCEQMKIQL